MKRLGYLIWLILLGTTLPTQLLVAQHTLSGTVLSKNNGAPIEMATIRLFAYTETPQGKDSTLVQGAQTSYDGMFVLNNIPQGKYRLLISSVGYAASNTSPSTLCVAA
mgnify:CR=1 FL=1